VTLPDNAAPKARYFTLGTAAATAISAPKRPGSRPAAVAATKSAPEQSRSIPAPGPGNREATRVARPNRPAVNAGREHEPFGLNHTAAAAATRASALNYTARTANQKAVKGPDAGLHGLTAKPHLRARQVQRSPVGPRDQAAHQ
jgi:hypothetical protein